MKPARACSEVGNAVGESWQPMTSVATANRPTHFFMGRSSSSSGLVACVSVHVPERRGPSETDLQLLGGARAVAQSDRDALRCPFTGAAIRLDAHPEVSHQMFRNADSMPDVS